MLYISSSIKHAKSFHTYGLPSRTQAAAAAKLAKLGEVARSVEHGIDIMDDSNVTIDALESGVRIRDKQQRAAIMQKLAQRAADEPPTPVYMSIVFAAPHICVPDLYL